MRDAKVSVFSRLIYRQHNVYQNSRGFKRQNVSEFHFEKLMNRSRGEIGKPERNVGLDLSFARMRYIATKLRVWQL